MTEPIIINNVDVSGCEIMRYSDNEQDEHPILCDLAEVTDNHYYCIKNPNCYYKQLKRKERELNEIKEDIKTGTFCVTCKRENENDKLRVESDKYKNTLNKVKELLDFNCEKYNNCSNFQMCICNVCVLYDDVLKIINEVTK